MRLRFGLVIVGCASLGLAGACSSFSGSGTELADGGDVDGGAVDTGTPPITRDASRDDAGAEGGGDILYEEGFETTAPAVGCAGWTGNEVMLTTTTDAPHGGASSCRACIAHDALDPSMEFHVPLAMGASGLYYFDVYARAGELDAGIGTAADAGVTQLVAALGFYEQTDTQLGFKSVAVAGIGAWTFISVGLSPTAPGAKYASLVVYLRPITAGRCFDVDDVVFSHEP